MVISDDSSTLYIMRYFKVAGDAVMLLTWLRMGELGVLLIWENMCSHSVSGPFRDNMSCTKKHGNVLYGVFICTCI